MPRAKKKPDPNQHTHLLFLETVTKKITTAFPTPFLTLALQSQRSSWRARQTERLALLGGDFALALRYESWKFSQEPDNWNYPLKAIWVVVRPKNPWEMGGRGHRVFKPIKALALSQWHLFPSLPFCVLSWSPENHPQGIVLGLERKQCRNALFAYRTSDPEKIESGQWHDQVRSHQPGRQTEQVSLSFPLLGPTQFQTYLKNPMITDWLLPPWLFKNGCKGDLTALYLPLSSLLGRALEKNQWHPKEENKAPQISFTLQPRREEETVRDWPKE